MHAWSKKVSHVVQNSFTITHQALRCSTLWNINVSFWLLIFTRWSNKALRCDGIFNGHFITHFLLSMSVELRILRIRRYLAKLCTLVGGLLFWTAHYVPGSKILDPLTVLLSRTWDSRTRTRTRTWKLVLEDPRGQGLSSRTITL